MITRNKTQLSIVVVGALLVIDFVWFGCLPSQKQLKIIRQLKEKQMGVVEVAKTRRAQFAGLRQELDRLESELDDLSRHIPSEKSIGALLTEISHLMARHGLTEQMIVPGAETVGEIAIQVPVTVHCEGHLREIHGFYEDLKGLDRLVRIDEIVLKNDAALAGWLRMEARVVVFYQPDSGWGGDRHVSVL